MGMVANAADDPPSTAIPTRRARAGLGLRMMSNLLSDESDVTLAAT
jgi:hypothetical protein